MTAQNQHIRRGTLIEKVRPKTVRVLYMHPLYKIEKNEDGTGGGITLRVSGDRPEPYLIDVIWGKSTELEIAL